MKSKMRTLFTSAAALAFEMPAGFSARTTPIGTNGLSQSHTGLIEIQWRHHLQQGGHRHRWSDGYPHRYVPGWGTIAGADAPGAATEKRCRQQPRTRCREQRVLS